MNFSVKMAIMTAFLIFASCFGQEKDSTITLSIPAIKEKIKFLDELKAREKKELEDGQYQYNLFIEMKNQNIIRIETMILDLIRIQTDTTLLIRKPE